MLQHEELFVSYTKMKKKLFLTAILLVFTIFLIGAIFVFAGSFNPEDERQIGYEFLDLNGSVVSSSQGEVVHIWNMQDDYFFNKSSGIQLTNHYQEYWSRNIFCLGYYSGEEWIKIKCADELTNFEKSIESDNETYVNATLWKDIIYEEYNFRLGIRHHLGLNDTALSVTIYGKNIGIDIPRDLGFAWKVTAVDIPPSNVTDEITINVTIYPLNGTYNLLFKDMDIANFKIRDSCQYLKVDWNENLSYAVKMYGDGNQEDFYVMLLVNAGIFNSGIEKSTTFYWIDAGTCTGTATPCEYFDFEKSGPPCSGCIGQDGCNWDWQEGYCYGTARACSEYSTESSCAYPPGQCGCTWSAVGNIYVNVADVWRDVEEVYVNVADVWQDVEAVYVNVADVWRQIY